MILAASRALSRLLLVLVLAMASAVQAAPIELRESFAGNLDFLVTGGTLRTQSNFGNACAVTNGTVSASLSGIPAGATIRAAYLYWGGSGATVDDTVTFEGGTVFADRTFTDTYNQLGYNLSYFGGVREVTPQVAAKGNGTYSFSGLSVTTTDQGGGASYCSSAAVVAGWGLLVIFEHPSQDFRVVNVFDGLRWFRGSSITLTPSNFLIPAAPVNGKIAVLTWEGDVDNSAPLNGFSENLILNGTPLTDALNPANNQFNSTVNALGSNSSWGVDLDIYPIGAFLSPGDTSVSTTYSSGGDLVLLTMEAVSVTNSPIADLSILKRRNGPLQAGAAGQYRIQVRNNGPLAEPGPIVVTDTLDNRLTYTGHSGTGWSCAPSGQTITCSHPGSLAVNAGLPDLFINVNIQAGTGGQSISNTASVSGTRFDNVPANNSSTATDFIYGAVSGIKNLYTYFSPNSLQRVVPTTNSQITIANNGNTLLTMTPALVRPLTIRAGNIPVSLCLQRTTNNTRNVRVELDYTGAATGTIGGQTLNNILGNNNWTSTNFSIALGSDLTLPAGTQLQLRIRNLTTNNNRNLNVSAYQFNCGGTNNISRVELDTPTVINVESVAVHDAPWPGGNVITTIPDNGSTVYLRSRVSDPFGSFDITSAILDVFDKDDNLVAGNLGMTQVDENAGVGERVFEFAGVPPDWTGSPYTLRVRANEGTEGTVFNFGATGLNVTPLPPLLMVTRLTSSASVDPGSTVTYTIQVSNAGLGDATAVEVTDALGPFLSLGLNSFGPGQVFEFTDGTPASGLTPDAALYSSDGGATYTYVPVSGGGGAPAGFDGLVSHFRLPLSGNMPPGSSFTITYTARVD